MKKSILSFDEFIKESLLLEQESSSDPIDFVVISSTDKTPMRDKTLNDKQKYPLAKGAKDQDMHIYTIELGDVIKGDFSKAKIGDLFKEDLIEVGEKKITKEGSIQIAWNGKDSAKTIIKVCGNGALALARAGKALEDITGDINQVKGVILLKIGSAKRASELFDISNFRLSISSLKTFQVTMIRSSLLYVLDSEEKKDHLKRLPNTWKWRDSFANNGAIPILDKKEGSDEKTWVYPKQHDEENRDLAKYFGRYSKKELEKNNNPQKITLEISKVVKEIINTGLDNLKKFVPEFLEKKLEGLDKNLAERLSKKAQNNVEKSKETFDSKSIAKEMVDTFVVVQSGIRKTEVGAPEKKSKEYKEGES